MGQVIHFERDFAMKFKQSVLNSKGKPCIMTVFVAFLCFALTGIIFEAAASAEVLAVKDVRIDRPELRPGGSVAVTFRITTNADVTVDIYSPDYDLVRRLVAARRMFAGTNTVFWDGRDDKGRLVPDEAYLFTIKAEDGAGQKVLYDPTRYSGGKVCHVEVNRLDRAAGNAKVTYTVPSKARTRIRAGIHNGPLLKTLLDWTPLLPGEYTQAWDGMDETGRIRLWDNPDAHVFIEAFTLPENTILVKGSGDNYPEYHRELERNVVRTDGALSYITVRRSTLAREDEDISSQYLDGQFTDQSPRFVVYAEEDRSVGLADKGVYTVSGDVPLIVELAPESLESFNESRYEIIVFVDNIRFDEEENAYSPYTYILATGVLSNGEHWVTMNLAGLDGQVGSYSFQINVNN